MSQFSDYLEQKISDLVYNGVAYTAPATYVALYTATPSDSGGGTEVTGGSYARMLVNANSGSTPKWRLAVTEGGGGYQVSNLNAITFATATADWGVITSFGILDASSSGNLLIWGALTANKTVSNGDTFTFAIDQLVLILR